MRTSRESLPVLLIEDNPGDARLITEYLRDEQDHYFHLEWVSRLEDGLNRLAFGDIRLVLLDLSLPDSHGLETLAKVHAQAPGVPIVVLTGNEDDALGLQAVQEGAQDFMKKDEVAGGILLRSMRYALERSRLQRRLEEISLTDELTGVYNRRGFLTLAEQILRFSERNQRRLLLLLADLDNLKWINDTHGHAAGDDALCEIVEILRQTFRRSDVLARIGGDEFVVLAQDVTAEAGEALVRRLQANISENNLRNPRRYELSLSTGIIPYDPRRPMDLDHMLMLADTLMYEEKREKHVRREAA